MKNLKLFPYQTLYFTSLKYEPLKHLFDAAKDEAVNKITPKDNYSILYLSGIARPELLQKHLEKYSNDIQNLRYPDHYTYKAKYIIFSVDLCHTLI